MSADAALIAHLMDVLRPLGGVAARRMFGGAGLFRDGLMFGLISDEVLYLKADAETVADFEAEGLGPFTYGTKSGDRVLTSYWRAPEHLLDDDDEIAEVGLALERRAPPRKLPVFQNWRDIVAYMKARKTRRAAAQAAALAAAVNGIARDDAAEDV